MVYPLEAIAPSVEPDRHAWSLAQRIAFRFAGVYLVLYLSDGWLQLLPWGGAVIDRWWQALGLWTGRHILHITTAIDVHRFGTGSGDTLLDYIRVLDDLAIASLATLVWSLAAARRRAAPALHHWLRVYVRYPLGIIMLGYGMAKVFPGQFGTGILPLDRLLEPYGHSSPMGILWTFMGYSRPYAIFCGLAEAVGGLLLFWQRTTTLGALIVAAGMANVAMLNFAYDVPVKLFSTHLFLFAVFLLLPDLGRLARVLVLNRPAPAAPERPPFTRVWPRRAALAVKTLLIGFVLYQNTWPYVQTARRPRTVNPRYGIYEVEAFTANGQLRPATPMDGRRWRRLIVSESGGITVQTMDDAMTRFRARDDKEKHTYSLTTIFNPYDTITLTYSEPGPEQFILTGKYQGEEVSVKMRKTSVPSFLLATRGFHWVSEYPYNR
jgi:hypothetical protein